MTEEDRKSFLDELRAWASNKPSQSDMQEQSFAESPRVSPQVMSRIPGEEFNLIINEEISAFRKSFLRWFIDLNFELAERQLFQLTEEQFGGFVSKLSASGNLGIPQPEVLDKCPNAGFEVLSECFDKGLVALAADNQAFVFPLARWISAMRLSFPFKPRESADILAAECYEFWTTNKHPLSTLEDSVQEVLSCFNERLRLIVSRRFGLSNGKSETLESIGQDLGLSRERIRQITNKFIYGVRRSNIRKGALSRGLLETIYSSNCSLLGQANSPAVIFCLECLGVLFVSIDGSNLALIGYPEVTPYCRSQSSITIGGLINWLDKEGLSIISERDWQILDKFLEPTRRKRQKKGEKLAMVIRALGRPSHYAEIAERYESMFPEDSVSEHNLHAILSREGYGVVWVGKKGTFALKEWGYEHPKEGIYKAVARIVRELFKRMSKPVPLAAVVAELGKTKRIVTEESLNFALHMNEDHELEQALDDYLKSQ